jgi:FixJ family two-component response regulator
LTVLKNRFGSPSPREHEIMSQVARGRLSKQIAGEIGITEATVKVRIWKWYEMAQKASNSMRPKKNS